MNKNKIFSLAAGALFSVLGLTCQDLRAQTLTTSLGVGGLGGTGGGSGIAWGGSFNVNSLGWAAFNADVLVAPLDNETIFAISPGFAFYPFDVDGFLFGGLVGVGFYRTSGNTSFGFNYGITGDFSISKKFSVGMNAKQHLLADRNSDSLWSVMMLVGYKFDGGGDW